MSSPYVIFDGENPAEKPEKLDGDMLAIHLPALSVMNPRFPARFDEYHRAEGVAAFIPEVAIRQNSHVARRIRQTLRNRTWYIDYMACR